MPVNLAALTSVAIAGAKRAGATATAALKRPAPPPNPLTGVQSGSAITQTIDVVMQSPASLARKYASFTDATVAVFCAANGMTFAPEPGHVLQVGGKTYRVTAIAEHKPAGAAIGYFIGGSA